jgi:nucleotide-binding universal stress UspA family protein
VIDATEYLPPTVLVWPAVLQREWENQVENHLKRLAVHYSKQKEVTSHAPLKGCAYKEICRAARQMRADLIIISTHGYTGSKRVFLGSTAERVIQFSPLSGSGSAQSLF